MFPQLRKIEQKYGDRVVIVGVHSPKFPAERETANLREAVLRYRIEHPVVNDRDFAIWHQYGGRAWPTLMFVDPEGRVIGKHEGELPFERFDPLVAGMLKEFDERGLLHPSETALQLEDLREPARPLSFPGKVLASDGRLYIADTNHHRILVAQPDGAIIRILGSGRPGLHDGPGTSAQFQQPQGLASGDGVLYVADTENHAIRRVDLASGDVRTLAGTGEQAPGIAGGGTGTSTPLSSPWDVALASRTLYIAMAGTHQIWSLDLVTDQVTPFAGTGREGLLDGPVAEAWFAQSSGLALAGDHLYVADSEVSAIRDIDLAAGTVRTLVGEDLFVFGDQDGEGEVVRLQHPLGISALKGMLLIADSYNNKIKRLDPATRTVSTWLGSGAAGDADGPGLSASFREPAGVCAGPDGLFIADTNNHRVAMADWAHGVVRTLIGPASPLPKGNR
ncbi:MAG: alkyl hydroperoxide reductase [Candidatus Dormibacteraeota bacterium]|nr:alkyl hydroperoxide reductase [Candidatus Dormibacteraeota bacterium]